MLITIARYFDPWEAHILRARLVAEGIPASVAGEQHMMADWPLSVALGGAALQVPSAHLDQAREVVALYHSGALMAELIAEHPECEDRCPVCGRTDLKATVPHGQRAALIASFLLASAPFPTCASRMQCNSCGHRWTYGSD